MVFIALDKTANVIVIADNARKETDYNCCHCDDLLTHVNASINYRRISHFRHNKGSDCALDREFTSNNHHYTNLFHIKWTRNLIKPEYLYRYWNNANIADICNKNKTRFIVRSVLVKTTYMPNETIKYILDGNERKGILYNLEISENINELFYFSKEYDFNIISLNHEIYIDYGLNELIKINRNNSQTFGNNIMYRCELIDINAFLEQNFTDIMIKKLHFKNEPLIIKHKFINNNIKDLIIEHNTKIDNEINLTYTVKLNYIKNYKELYDTTTKYVRIKLGTKFYFMPYDGIIDIYMCDDILRDIMCYELKRKEITFTSKIDVIDIGKNIKKLNNVTIYDDVLIKKFSLSNCHKLNDLLREKLKNKINLSDYFYDITEKKRNSDKCDICQDSLLRPFIRKKNNESIIDFDDIYFNNHKECITKKEFTNDSRLQDNCAYCNIKLNTIDDSINDILKKNYSDWFKQLFTKNDLKYNHKKCAFENLLKDIRLQNDCDYCKNKLMYDTERHMYFLYDGDSSLNFDTFYIKNDTSYYHIKCYEKKQLYKNVAEQIELDERLVHNCYHCDKSLKEHAFTYIHLFNKNYNFDEFYIENKENNLYSHIICHKVFLEEHRKEICKKIKLDTRLQNMCYYCDNKLNRIKDDDIELLIKDPNYFEQLFIKNEDVYYHKTCYETSKKKELETQIILEKISLDNRLQTKCRYCKNELNKIKECNMEHIKYPNYFERLFIKENKIYHHLDCYETSKQIKLFEKNRFENMLKISHASENDKQIISKNTNNINVVNNQNEFDYINDPRLLNNCQFCCKQLKKIAEKYINGHYGKRGFNDIYVTFNDEICHKKCLEKQN